MEGGDSNEEAVEGEGLKLREGGFLVSSWHSSSLLQVPQLICGPAEPETPLTIVESPPPACVEPGVKGQPPASVGASKDTSAGNRKCFSRADS